MTALPLTPTGLRCAHQADPLGVAPDRVRLSWRLEGAGIDRAQHVYQLLVTDDADTVAWDSGRVESAASADIAYPGLGSSPEPPLIPAGRYRWKVRVWDESGRASDWSDPARFEVELDRTSGWHASWIGPSPIREAVTPPSGAGPVDPVTRALTPAPYLRRAFTVDQPVASARLYVTALGLYEARLNGRRVGDGFLTPGWTDYTRRIAYQTYDVTRLLAEGENVLGAILADGWYAGFYGFDAKRAGAHYGTAPELLAQLVLRLADGSEQRIVTDGQWESSTGAIRHADLLMGERHDLALEPSGWDMPGFGARDWRPVRCRERDATPLVADPGPPIRVTEEIAPRSIATDDHGRHIVDFGQNLTGWLRINSRRAAGDARPDPARRGARGRRQPVHRQPAHRPGHRRVHHGRRPGGARAAVHPARIPVRRDHRLPRRHRPGRHHRPGRPLRHARDRKLRVLAAVAGPAVPHHRLGAAGQLHQRPHRLPAARRAARLAGRRPGLRPHRLLQPRRRRVLRQMAGRRDRRPAALRRLHRRRPPAHPPRRRRAGLGRRRGDRPVDDVEDVRRHRGPGPALRRHDQVDGLPRAGQPRLPAGPGARQQLQRLARPGRRRHPARTARHRLLGPRRGADGRDRRRDRAARRGRGVPGAAGQDPVRVHRRVRGRRRADHLRHPDRLRPRPAHEPDPRRPAGRRGGSPRGRDPGRGLAPDHRVRRRRVPAAGAELHRSHRRRPTGCSSRTRCRRGGT